MKSSRNWPKIYIFCFSKIIINITRHKNCNIFYDKTYASFSKHLGGKYIFTFFFLPIKPSKKKKITNLDNSKNHDLIPKYRKHSKNKANKNIFLLIIS